ncbi:MAG TPA: hypothetical protein VF745_16990 [Steroidobacteraceae bacterium]
MTRMSVLKAAEFLAWARRSGAPGGDLPADLAPADIEQGYAIQVEAARLRRAGTAGYKVGLTSAEAQQATGASAPIAGRLALADIRRGPANIALPQKHLRIVEAEFVFEIGRRIGAENLPLREACIHEHIRTVYAGIEICNSRLSAEDPPLPAVIADNSYADLLVIGDAISNWRAELEKDVSVVLSRRCGAAIHGSSGRVLGSPARSVVWLANWLASRGESLECGDFIASGSCTGMTPVAPTDSVVATFGDAARASVQFESTLG